MTTTQDILDRGYFPKELPPLFSTRSLATHYLGLPSASEKVSYCLRYSYSKYATVRRALSIPNPAHFIPLAEAIATHWSMLEAHCADSPISKTRPTASTDRAIVWATSLDDIPLLRSQQRVGARYVLQADVAAFYASMYTHVIPWALHTKAVAKVDRSLSLEGNLLDSVSRNIQSGQTVGIPIGPDTSIVIAEAVLTEVDKLIAANLPSGKAAFRFVDDYEFVCETLTEAEHARNVLQDALGEYELQLNPRKTRILELPNVLDTPWVHELAAFQLESQKPAVFQSRLIRYFSRAFELAKDNPGEPILKYAVRRLSEVNCKSAAGLAQQLLFQAAVIDPGTLQTAMHVAYVHQAQGLELDVNALERALTAIICRHSVLQHGGDIAWALWGSVVFGIKLQEEAVNALEKLTDPIAILMALFADSRGAFARSISRSKWEPLAIGAELFERQWLVGYEAVEQGWFSGVTTDPAISDPFFNECRKRGILFIDVNTKLQIPAPSKTGEYD
jgi:hypothetical protein